MLPEVSKKNNFLEFLAILRNGISSKGLDQDSSKVARGLPSPARNISGSARPSPRIWGWAQPNPQV